MGVYENASTRRLRIHPVVDAIFHIGDVRCKLGELKLWTINNGISMIARFLSRLHTIPLPLFIIGEDCGVIFS